MGNPPTTYQLIVDTGSSNTFVGANQQYVATSSSQDTGNPISVTYGSGEFSGEECECIITPTETLLITNFMYSTVTDDVTIGGITISSQSIGVANQSQGFDGLDGILGLGPDDLTLDTLVNEPGTIIPTVTDVSNRYMIDFDFPDHNILESRFARKGRVCLGRNLLTSFIGLRK